MSAESNQQLISRLRAMELGPCNDAADRIAALDRQNGRLMRQLAAQSEDAARYRLIRKGQQWSVINGIGDTLRADELDAAIDQAMQAGKEKGNG